MTHPTQSEIETALKELRSLREIGKIPDCTYKEAEDWQLDVTCFVIRNGDVLEHALSQTREQQEAVGDDQTPLGKFNSGYEDTDSDGWFQHFTFHITDVADIREALTATKPAERTEHDFFSRSYRVIEKLLEGIPEKKDAPGKVHLNKPFKQIKFLVEFYRASLEATKPAGWRTIDSAPDNISVLGYIPNAEHYGPGVYRCIKINMGTGIHWSVSGLHMGRDTGPDYEPTHWMPLPAPPAENGEA